MDYYKFNFLLTIGEHAILLFETN